MGSLPQSSEAVGADEIVRVRLLPAWLRIDARFGSVYRRRGDPALVLRRSISRRIAQPQRQDVVEMVHELLQAHPIFDVAEPVDRALGKRNSDTEQSRSQNAVVGVVGQLTPLPGLRQRSALKTDGIHRAVAFSELFLELRTVDQTPLKTVRKHTVDVLARPDGRPTFEAGVV